MCLASEVHVAELFCGVLSAVGLMNRLEQCAVVASGSMQSYDFASVRCRGEIVHLLTVTGALTLDRRLPLYRATLAANPTSDYICILDNRKGHENNFSYSDMKTLNQVLYTGGVRTIHGVTITSDAGYANLLAVANQAMVSHGLTGHLHSTADPDEAEEFILHRLDAIIRARERP